MRAFTSETRLQLEGIQQNNVTNCAVHPVYLASAVNLEGELFKDLMKGYNKNVRPTEKSGDITQVDIKMTLTNLISLVSEIQSSGLILTQQLIHN